MGRSKKNFIADMHLKKGALHKEMGIPADKTIPQNRLEKAAHAGGKLGKRARLAQTLEKLHK